MDLYEKGMQLKPRDRFIRSITFQPVDRPARTDMFCLLEEQFGRTFPDPSGLSCGSAENRRAVRREYVDLYERMARELGHDAIIVWHPFTGPANLEVIAALRERVGDEFAIIGFASAFWGMERITDHEAFAGRLYEDRKGAARDRKIVKGRHGQEDS